MSEQRRMVIRLGLASIAILLLFGCGGDSAVTPEPVDVTWDLTGHFDTVRTEGLVTCGLPLCYSYAATNGPVSGTVVMQLGHPRAVTLNGREYTWYSSTDGECFLATDGPTACLTGVLESSSWSGRIVWYDRAGPHASQYSGPFTATRR